MHLRRVGVYQLFPQTTKLRTESREREREKAVLILLLKVLSKSVDSQQ